MDFAADQAGRTWDDVNSEAEALDILRKQADVRRGTAFVYLRGEKLLVSRPCKNGGKFVDRKGATLLMFGDPVEIAEGK